MRIKNLLHNKSNKIQSLSHTHSRRLKAPRFAHPAFTIVELLIVIVVIAILAAITIVAYNGIQNKAIESGMLSILRDGSNHLDADAVKTGVFPETLADANNGQGIDTTYDYATLQYSVDSDGMYCLSVSSPKTSKIYHIDSIEHTIESGFCSGHSGAVVSTYYSGLESNTGGILADGDNIIVAEWAGNCRLLRITPSGTATVIAGSTRGYANGTGGAAQFDLIYGIVRDSSGNIFVATGDNRIRKVTSAGVVTTFAGSGTAGYIDATGTSAQFYDIRSIDIDSSNNLYVGESGGMYGGNPRIRKITPAGVVTTLTTDLGAFPNGLAVDSSGNVYVGDQTELRKVTPGGVVTLLAGGGGSGSIDGTGSEASFARIGDLTIDTQGNLYASDSYYTDHRIRKITPAGVVTTIAGAVDSGFVDGIGANARFSQPSALAMKGVNELLVGDNYNYAIRVVKL